MMRREEEKRKLIATGIKGRINCLTPAQGKMWESLAARPRGLIVVSADFK
jgi:hypothetical protein